MQIIFSIELPWTSPTKVKKKKKVYTLGKQARKNIFLKFIYHHFFLKIFVCIFVCFSLFGGTYAYIRNNEATVATFTDSVIRPTLGNQTTLVLEAAFFNLDDKMNQIKYMFDHSNETANAFTPNSSPSIATISTSPTPSQFPLESIKPLSGQSIEAGEGKWESLVSTNGAILMAKTFVHPDIERPYAVVNLVKMNMNTLQIDITAGTMQPGGPSKPGPGKIPLFIQQSNDLVGAFDGGFQQKDGYYGMIAENTTYLPLEKNLATLVMYQDEKPSLIKYTGQSLGDTVRAIRQNCPMLIENSQIVTSSNAWNMQTWGLTTTNSMYTWRSGLGITKEGDLVYASGPSLVPETLAKALLSAGAVNAMQLDINPFWVRFVLFSSLGKGQYQYMPLDPSMVNGGNEYLHGYQKDFFYVYKK